MLAQGIWILYRSSELLVSNVVQDTVSVVVGPGEAAVMVSCLQHLGRIGNGASCIKMVFSAVVCFRELQGTWVKTGDVLARYSTKIGPAQAS